MQSGARLSLNRLVWGVLNYYNLALAQLVPNVFELMAGMYVLWHQCKFEALTREEFCFAYKPSLKNAEGGYFFMVPWQPKDAVMKNLSSSFHGWTDKFFWVGGNFDLLSTNTKDSIPHNFWNHGDALSLSLPFYLSDLFPWSLSPNSSLATSKLNSFYCSQIDVVQEERFCQVLKLSDEERCSRPEHRRKSSDV